MSEQELQDLVERAWRVACRADISDAPMHRGCDGLGQPILDMVRYQTYQVLLASLVPKTITQVLPKEPWQE